MDASARTATSPTAFAASAPGYAAVFDACERFVSMSGFRDCIARPEGHRIYGVHNDAARAFWVVSPGHGEIRTESLAAPSAHEVLVRATYSGVSRGTEALVFQ